LQEAKLIVKGLRGCCGQMDCQTDGDHLWIPMNTQHKVCQYDRDGELINSFGKQGREAADAFGGCCEPKNMRFGSDGYVYCAESGPPVCVKRFTTDGQFQDVVCLPLYETGCVRVSVDMWEDDLFLLSPNENAIYVFAPNHEG
jgi:sugar lactone lactonase YvrE